jgi:hypothetical protein
MTNENSSSFVRSAGNLAIVVAVAIAVGRVLTVERIYKPILARAPGEVSSPYPPWPEKRPMPTPLLGSNDRSRWCTIRALVDEGTYVIGHRDPAKAAPENRYGDYGIVFEDGWTSVDKVLRPGAPDEPREFYSSKPPLLPTLLAGEYWLLKHAFGWTLAGDAPTRWWVVRVVLFTVNVLPLAIYLVLLERLVGWLGVSDWGRLFVIMTACFGTFVTSFTGTLNNHLIAACSVVFALAPALWAAFGTPEQDRGWRYALAGFFASFAACNELPAASFAALLLLLLFMHSPRKTLTFSIPMALIPVVAFFVCNYVAIGQFKPAYGELGGPWYEYPGSNFNPQAPEELRRGVDWASKKETYATYVFHFLLGHHGLFSLTPIWLLAIPGIAAGLRRRRRSDYLPKSEPGKAIDRSRETSAQRAIALLTLITSIVVISFYLSPLTPKNYSGWTLGLRWLVWLTPLWLLSLVPIVDWLATNRFGRALACLLLALSVMSVILPAGSPWHHPWIYTILEQQDGPLY